MTTNNQDPADAQVIYELARRAEFYHDFLVGVAGQNPRGLNGVDMSGAPFGQRLENSYGGSASLIAVTGWTRNALESAPPYVRRGRVWVKPGTSYTDMLLKVAVLAGGSAGDLRVLFGDTDSTVAFTGSATPQILTVGSIPVERGWNDVKIQIYSQDAVTILGCSLS